MEQKTRLIKIGDFFFKYRNALFPLLLITLFCLQTPPSEYEGHHSYEHWKDMVAVIITATGLLLRAAVIGFRYIKRGGLNKQVYADKLVTEGFFAACRNPLYVGNMIIYFGVLLMHGSPIVFVLGMAFFTFVYTAIIAAEEYFLRNKFGAEYEAYCRTTPRWGIKWSRLPAATKGMRFHFRRVIAKDYTTITNAVVAIVGLEMWEDIAVNVHTVHWSLFLGLIGTAITGMFMVRFVKKRGLLGDVA